MNYADEATRFLDEANEAEVAARWRSEELLKEAEESVMVGLAKIAKGNIPSMIKVAHKGLKDKDLDYQGHVGMNQWMLQKATANFLAALVHQHVPTDKYDRARS